MMKWLTSNVLPGVALVLASPLWLHSMLMSDDFPTLLRPINANSGLLSDGHMLTLGADITNCEFTMSIMILILCKGSEYCWKKLKNMYVSMCTVGKKQYLCNLKFNSLKPQRLLFPILIACLLASCSATKFVPEEKYLWKVFK